MAAASVANPRRRRRPPAASLLRRWLAVAALVLVAFLYYKPLRSYFETREELARRSAEVRALAEEKRALEARLAAQATTAALAREARRLGYVKPGERLYIVKGIPAWRHDRAKRRAAAAAPD